MTTLRDAPFTDARQATQVRTLAIREAITVAPDGEVQITKVSIPRGVSRPKPRRMTPQWHDLAKQRIARIFGKLDAQKEQRTTAYITAIIPAANEAKSIYNTLASLLNQTRPVDQVVVVVNGSTDKTAAIVQMFVDEFPGMVFCVENPVEIGRTGRETKIESKVAALNYGWKHYVALRPMSGEYDEYVFGLDADVVLSENVIALLESTLDADADEQRIGGVRPVYGFETPEEAGWRTRSLVAAQKIDFAGTELKDQLRRDNQVTILGGQSTLFRREALEKVSVDNKNKGPWNAESLVEDAYLTRKFEEHGYIGVVNPKAHVIVGAMHTTHAWWNQRRKWQNGHLIDVASDLHPLRDRVRWSQQTALAFNWFLRVLFVTMLVVSLVMHAFVFNWWWLIPIGIASLQGTLVASLMKNRSPWLIIRSATYILPEIYTWKTLAVWLASQQKIVSVLLRSSKTDQSDWIRQAKAESSNRVGSWPMWLTIVLSPGIPIVIILAVGNPFPEVVAQGLSYGWDVLAVMSVIASIFMLIKIVRIVKNYHNLSL